MKQKRRNKRNKMKYTYRKKRTRKRTLKRKRTRKRGGAIITTNAPRSNIVSNVPPDRIQSVGDTTQITQGATTSEKTLLSSLIAAYPVPVHQDWLEDITESLTTKSGKTLNFLKPKTLGYISAHGTTVLYINGEPIYTIIPNNINIIFYSDGGGKDIKPFTETDIGRFSYYPGGALCEEYNLQFYPGYEGTGHYSKRGVYDNTKRINLSDPDNIVTDIMEYKKSEGWRPGEKFPKALMDGLQKYYDVDALQEEEEEEWDLKTSEFNWEYAELNAELLNYFYEDKWSIINITDEERRPTLSPEEEEKVKTILSDNAKSSTTRDKTENQEFTWNGPKRNFSDLLKLLSEKKAADPSLPDVYVCSFCRGAGFIVGMEPGTEVVVGMGPLSKCGELFKDHGGLGLDASELPLLSQSEISLPGELRRDSSLASSNALNYFREILDELIEYGNKNTTSWLEKLEEINEKNRGKGLDDGLQHCLDREEVCFILQLRHTLSLRHVP